MVFSCVLFPPLVNCVSLVIVYRFCIIYKSLINYLVNFDNVPQVLSEKGKKKYEYPIVSHISAFYDWQSSDPQTKKKKREKKENSFGKPGENDHFFLSIFLVFSFFFLKFFFFEVSYIMFLFEYFWSNNNNDKNK